MVWRGRERDPTLDPAAPDVLAAYKAAGDARMATAACYRAGVEAWRRVHPDQKATYAAKQAVAVILASKARSLMRVG
jgi:hypothetical protein